MDSIRSTTPLHTIDTVYPIDALIETRLTIASLVGLLRELAERPGAERHAIERAVDFYETGCVWLGEAIAAEGGC